MSRFYNFENANLVKPPYVIINGVEYEVHPAEYEGNPLTAGQLNEMQNNIDSIKLDKTTVLLDSTFDMNDLTDDGKYFNLAANNPTNKPANATSNAAYIEVIKSSDAANAVILQRWTEYGTDTVFERQRNTITWQNWVVVSKQPKILWQDTGGSYMNGSQRATLNEPISAQQSGIILLFQPYRNGSPTSWGWYTHFFPKSIINFVGAGYGQNITIPDNSDGIQAGKYLYFYDNYIEGNDINGQTTTMFGQTVDNRNVVLTKIIGI